MKNSKTNRAKGYKKLNVIKENVTLIQYFLFKCSNKLSSVLLVVIVRWYNDFSTYLIEDVNYFRRFTLEIYKDVFIFDINVG